MRFDGFDRGPVDILLHQREIGDASSSLGLLQSAEITGCYVGMAANIVHDHKKLMRDKCIPCQNERQL